MKSIVGIIAVLALLCPLTFVMHAGVDFGSPRAGFVVHSGTFDVGTGAFSDGMIRLVEDGVLDGGSSNWSNMIFSDSTGPSSSSVAMTLDGQYVVDGPDLTIGTNQVLRVDGGSVTPEIHVNGTAIAPALLVGYGTFASDIVINAGKQLSIQWFQPLATHILGNDGNTTLKLEDDLVFAPGKAMSPASMYTLIVDFNGHKMVMGGLTPTAITGTQVWNNANLWLVDDVALANNATVTFGGEADAAYINGQGNTLSFGTSSYFDNNGLTVKLVDLTFRSMNSSSFQGIGQWQASRVLFDNGSNGKIQVDGMIEGRMLGSFDIFGVDGDTTFTASTVTLQNDTYLQGNWVFETRSVLNGNGRGFDLSAGKITYNADLALTDIVLASCTTSSFYSVGENNLYLSNVTWSVNNEQSCCEVKISGVPGKQEGATVVLPSGDNVGNIFDAQNVTFSGAHIEFIGDVALTNGARWTFSDTSVVDGHGCYFDLFGGALAFSNNAVVTFQNMVIDRVTADALVGGGGAAIRLFNVTIKISENVDWALRTPVNNRLMVTGPVTIVTGDYTFTAPHNSTVDGVTLFYDTLGALDKNNVTGFSFVNSGRCMIVDRPIEGDIVIGTPGVNYLSRNEVLNTANRIINFAVSEGPVNYVYNGLGRSVTFPSATNAAVMAIESDVTVTTQNILFNGFDPAMHLDNSGSLAFCDQTIIRLDHDITLNSNLQFGTSTTTDQAMVLDLNGFTIIMDEFGSIDLAGDEPVGEENGNVLRICNGRITQLSGFQLAAGDYARIILENVELELAGNTTYNVASLDIEGRCSITGQINAIFDFASLNSLTIKKGAQLVIGDGVKYCHNNAGTTNFVFEDLTSQLVLVGSTFSCKETTGGDPLVLCVGTLIVDHLVTINVNSIGMVWSDGAAPLSVEILPGALITVDGAGTLAYQPVVS
jgi:hypothetical protein